MNHGNKKHTSLTGTNKISIVLVSMRLCGPTCEHGFEIVRRGGHHGTVYRESFIAIPSHQRDVT